MILGYFNIDHTTVVQTPCIHIRLLEDVGIVTLLHYTHVNFLVFGVHLAHDVHRFSLNLQEDQFIFWHVRIEICPRYIKNFHVSPFMCIDDEAVEKSSQVNCQI